MIDSGTPAKGSATVGAAAADDPNIETRLSTLENSRQQFETAYDAKVTELQGALKAAQDALMAAIRSAVPVGQIMMHAGNVKGPEGFLLCDGSLYTRDQYPALCDEIKATWGGDGATNFKVPELRGVFPRFYNQAGGPANSRRADANGQFVNSDRNFGQEEPFLTAMPKNALTVQANGVHTHGIQAAPDHTHGYSEWRYTVASGQGPYGDGLTANPANKPTVQTTSAGGHSHALVDSGGHDHVITGGDPETRPINQALVGYIRY